MRIELGKTYVNRVGLVTKIVGEVENPIFEWLYRGEDSLYYSEEGKVFPNRPEEHPHDLVEEYLLEGVEEFLKSFDEVQEADRQLQQSKYVQEAEDMVNSPSHYLEGGVEAIDMIRLMLTDEEFKGYCKGNMLKYRLRAPFKGKTEEDVNKAAWYYEAARGNK